MIAGLEGGERMTHISYESTVRSLIWWHIAGGGGVTSLTTSLHTRVTGFHDDSRRRFVLISEI